ncbi:hypothetical protein ACHAXT_003319 [Thalassiosira profunda]
MPSKRALALFAALALGRIEPAAVLVDAFVSPFCNDAPPSRLSATGSAATSTSDEETTTIPAITERMLALTQNPAVAIVIDVENVRGKTGFELDHADLLDRLVIWASRRNRAQGRTIAVVDHGSRSSAHLLHHGGDSDCGAALCVSFAGPNVKADDIIARDVSWLLSSPDTTVKHVVVITADQELAWRCRSAAWAGDRTVFNSVLRKFADDNGFQPQEGGRDKDRKKGRKKKSRAARKRQYLQRQEDESEGEEGTDIIRDGTNATEIAVRVESDAQLNADAHNNTEAPTVEVIAPQRFLEDLEQAMLEWLGQQEEYAFTDSDDAAISVSNIPIPAPVSTLQSLFHLRGQILTLESALRKRCSLHKRHTLTGELRKCKEKWRDTLSSIATADDAGAMNTGGRQSLTASLAWSLSSSISKCDDDEANASMPQFSPLPSSPDMSWEKLSKDEQEKLLLRWGKRRGRHGTRRERTQDRIVLAERLRRQLELILDASEEARNDEEGSLVVTYADYINAM